MRILKIAAALLALASPVYAQGIAGNGGGIAGNNYLTPFGPINTTSSSGYQQNGQTVLNVLNGTPYQEGVLVGPRAGSSLPNAIAYGAVAFGPSALRSLTNTSSESAAFGPYSCEFLTTAYGATCIGEHTIGFDNSSYLTAVGNDSMRDVIGASNSTAVGAATYDDGVGANNTVVGALSMQGNAGSITLSGTPTAGDVLKVSFTTTNANVTGLPATASVTVASGDTLVTLATKIANAIGALGVSYTLPDGVTTLTESGVQLAAIASSTSPYIKLHFPGSATAGWAITPTTSCTGSCTETLTVGSAFSGTDNVVIGQGSFLAFTASNASYNVIGGSQAAQKLTGGGNVCFGYQCGSAFTSDNNDVVLGYQAGLAANGTSYTVLLGSQSGAGLTTGGNNTILGAQPISKNCITTGTTNIEVGIDACVPSATASGQMSIQNIIYGVGNTSRNSTPSTGSIGIGQIAPGARFDILGTGTGSELVFRAQNSAGTFVMSASDNGAVTFTGLASGTPATYACFTSGGQLISSATAC